MSSDLTKQRERAKQLLLEKLKNLKINSDYAPSVVSSSNHPTPIEPPAIPAPTLQRYTIPAKPQPNMMASNHSQAEEDHFEMESKKEEKEEEDKLDDFKDLKKPVRTRRPYYEHYVKEGVFVPVLDYVRNHPNPSGKPPNIPAEMYEGIEVVPKRPWVFFGPQNIPPSDCQQINEKTFSAIFENAKKNKTTGIFKKNGKKKGGKRNEDEISQVSDEFTSNFTFSDSVDLSKESDLISEFRTQTKTMKVFDSGNMEESQVEDQFSSVSGSVTQRHRYNLFDSSQSQQQDKEESKDIQNDKKKKKFRKLLDSSSDEESEFKSSTNKISSLQGSSGIVNAGSSGIVNAGSSGIVNAGSSGNQASGMVIPSSKGSSERVEVDDGQSSMSMSMSRSKSRSRSRSRGQFIPETPPQPKPTQKAPKKQAQPKAATQRKQSPPKKRATRSQKKQVPKKQQEQSFSSSMSSS